MHAPPYLVDATGLACPLPVLALAKAIRGQPMGAVVRLVATDPATAPDVRAWCASTGHPLLRSGWEGARFWADVQKGPI